MLEDKDRIFTNVYGFQPWNLSAAQKRGEEATEAVSAAVTADRAELVKESADVLFHLLVVLRAAGVPLADVMAELDARTAQSGLAEKAARKANP